MSDLEYAISEQLDDKSNRFVKDLSSKDEISFQDLSQVVTDHFDDNSDVIKSIVEEHLAKIIENAKEQARKMIGKPKTAMIRTAGRFEDSLNKAFEKIDSIPTEIIDKIKAEWIETGGDKNLIPQLIKKELQEFKEEGYDAKELKKGLEDLYRKQLSIYRTVVRNTTVNAYAKTQIVEWDENGIIEVERHCIDDARTCPICRALCAPGRNIYQIKDLLQLDDPITYFSHPQCRDFFTPRVDWAELNEFFTEPIIDLDIDESSIQNIPVGLQPAVEELNDRLKLEGDFTFVPDIVDTQAWQDHQLQMYLDMDIGEREARNLVKLDRETMRGTILSFEDSDRTFVSGQATNASNFAYSLSVKQANDSWSDADKDYWISHYDDTMGSDRPFISILAEESAKNMFIEEWILFHTNPYRLITIDPDGYDELVEMTGNDFFSRGAVR